MLPQGASISTAIGLLSRLTALGINDQDLHLVGTIPTGFVVEFCGITRSRSTYQKKKNMATEIGLLTALLSLALTESGLSGTLPSELALLTNLQVINCGLRAVRCS